MIKNIYNVNKIGNEQKQYISPMYLWHVEVIQHQER